MSRYIKNLGPKTLAVGWDRPMRTYFAQVSINQSEDDLRDLPLEVCLGGGFDEFTDLAEFEAELNKNGYRINQHIKKQLKFDQDGQTAPSNLIFESGFQEV